jgi:hypothetical protein
VIRHPSAVQSPPVEEFEPPADLGAEERAIWQLQATHAFAKGTLTKASALSFARYCKVVVLERAVAKSQGVSGPNHRGLLRLVNTLETQFMLAPSGKAMRLPAAPTGGDPDDEFFRKWP